MCRLSKQKKNQFWLVLFYHYYLLSINILTIDPRVKKSLFIYNLCVFLRYLYFFYKPFFFTCVEGASMTRWPPFWKQNQSAHAICVYRRASLLCLMKKEAFALSVFEVLFLILFVCVKTALFLLLCTKKNTSGLDMTR